MNTIYKLVAVLGIGWAIFVAPLLYFHAAKSGHDRLQANLIVVSRDMFTKEHLRNGSFVVPENYGDAFANRTQRLLQAEEQQSARLAVMTWVSSAFILVLSLYAWKSSGRSRPPSG